jgi:hypothetical protein
MHCYAGVSASFRKHNEQLLLHSCSEGGRNRQDDLLDPEVSDNAAYLAGATREKLISNKIDVSSLV